MRGGQDKKKKKFRKQTVLNVNFTKKPYVPLIKRKSTNSTIWATLYLTNFFFSIIFTLFRYFKSFHVFTDWEATDTGETDLLTSRWQFSWAAVYIQVNRTDPTSEPGEFYPLRPEAEVTGGEVEKWMESTACLNVLLTNKNHPHTDGKHTIHHLTEDSAIFFTWCELLFTYNLPLPEC